MNKKALYMICLIFISFFFGGNVCASEDDSSSKYQENKAYSQIQAIEEQKEQKALQLDQTQSADKINKITDMQNSLNVQNEQNNQNTQDPFIALKNDYIFVLFYRSTCPYCRAFDPTLKSFADHYGFNVEAFTTDGESLPSFPNSTPIDPKIVQAFFGVGAELEVPTLFLLNTHNGHVYPVSTGALSAEELLNRMSELAPKIVQNESNENNKGYGHG